MSFSAMYVGATGVQAMGQKMNVIGNNLANVDTVGFRESEVLFQNLMSRYAAGGQVLADGRGSAGQIGMGVSVADIRIMFQQGGFENGVENTDMAINGKGMFRVVSPASSQAYYTRAGNFRFNNAGFLTDPHGNVLQGMPVDSLTGALGATTDIQLVWETEVINGVPTQVIRSSPTPTTALTFDFNLDKKEIDYTANAANPFFALSQAWDGTAEPPLSRPSYAYANSINVYDAGGVSHALTMYFDKAPVADPGGNTYWEYVVGIDPADDGRAGIGGTSGAGMLMIGSLTFNRYGELVGQTAFTFSGAAAGDVKLLSNWTPAAFSAEGYPSFDVNFLSSGAGAAAQGISLNLGLRSTTGAWNNLGSNASAASVGADQGNLPVLADIWRDAFGTTGYDSALATLNQNQNGYPPGYLNNISVTSEGFLRGLFSNGQTQDFYQIPLYVFRNEFGLRREGSNLFTVTDQSGAALEGLALNENRGSIDGRMLETSNVDMSEQFVDMITTQRGYQANTKIITTADTLLNTAITMKR